MDKENNWIMKLTVFLLWALSTVLSFWVMVAARQSFLVSLANLYVKDSIVRGWQARFYDKVFFIVSGLILLITIFVVDGYLRDAIKRQDVWRRAARVFGVELLTLFIFDLVNALVGGGTAGVLGILLLIGECIFGAGLYAFSAISKPKGRARQA